MAPVVLELDADLVLARGLVGHAQRVGLGGEAGAGDVELVGAAAHALHRHGVADQRVVERPHRLDPPLQALDGSGRRQPQPVGAVAADRRRTALVPRPGADPTAHPRRGQRLEDALEVMAARLLEGRGAEADHLRRGVQRVRVQVVLREGGEGRVHEAGQVPERDLSVGLGALGRRQHVAVGVDQPRRDDHVGGVDHPGARVGGDEIGELADVGDAVAGDGHPAVAEDPAPGVDGDDPPAADDQRHRRPGLHHGASLRSGR
jgi:hypothetical protein